MPNEVEVKAGLQEAMTSLITASTKLAGAVQLGAKDAEEVEQLAEETRDILGRVAIVLSARGGLTIPRPG
jgi:hypothetical protein